MDLASVAVSMISMGGLGALFATGLAVANKKLHVETDPRIALIVDNLPGANCGGCGLPGCGNFSENVVMGEIAIGDCPVCNDDAREAIAEIMGLEATKGEKIIARVLCQGGHYESASKGEYLGIEKCTAAHITGGGDKLCLYGCLGYGECVESCPFDAMEMSENGLPLIDLDKCTGCGNCVEACPVPDTLEMQLVGTRRKIRPRAVAIGIVGIFMIVTGLGMATGYWQNSVTTEQYLTLQKNVKFLGHPTGMKDIDQLNRQSELDKSQP